jgi:transposase
MYETGAMRRVHLQGRKNILKRLLIHGAAFNLSLILRKVLGAGTPRGFGDLHTALLTAVKDAWASFRAPGWLFRRDPDNCLRKAA